MKIASIIRYVIKTQVFLSVSSWTLRVLRLITECGSGELGYLNKICANCGNEYTAALHCNSRNCPNCGGVNRREWAAKVTNRLLPVPHFHLVFTVPHEFNPLFIEHKSTMLKILMNSVSETLNNFAQKNLGGTPAYVAILHTWTQHLLPHYHVHVLMAAGALSHDREKWIKSKNNFLFPVRALASVFKAIFIRKLQDLFSQKKIKYDLNKLPKKWHAYCQPPFNSEVTCIKYFALYANRIAVSEKRILDYNQEEVTIAIKRDPGEHDPGAVRTRSKSFKLTLTEFVLRFAIHILPRGFQKIRYFGIYANRASKEKIKIALEFTTKSKLEKLKIKPRHECPVCKSVMKCVVHNIKRLITGPPRKLAA